jgi:hypothetical protein
MSAFAYRELLRAELANRGLGPVDKLILLLVVVWFLLASPGTAQAYLDPGAGSLMVQAVLGGSAALFVIAKLCWRRVLAFLGLRK